MLKIAHLSDCHLGFGRSDWRFVRGDVYRGFDEAVRGASAWADLLLITGDLFDSSRLDIEAVSYAAQRLKRLDQPVILVGGNHDVPSTLSESPLTMLKELCPHLFVAERRYERFDLLGIEVHCVPARYLQVWKHRIHPSGDAILAIHGVHPNSPMKPPSDTWLIPQLYDVRSFLYVALGDLHDYHSVPTLYPPREYYAGSTAYCSSNIWSEGRPKGWLKVTGSKVEFVTVPQRAWITVSYDLDEQGDQVVVNVAEALRDQWRRLKAVGRVRDDAPVLRVLLHGSDRCQLEQAEQALLKGGLDAKKVYVVRRWKRMQATRTSVRGNLIERWIDYVRANSDGLPKGIDQDEIISRGVEAMMKASEGHEMTAALRTLVDIDDDYDPDDPFFK